MDFQEYAKKTAETAVYPGSKNSPKTDDPGYRVLITDGKRYVPEEDVIKMKRRYEATIGLNYVMLGLGNEAGEALGKIKKLYRDDDGVLTSARQDALIDELGDVLWYWARACEELGVDPENVAYRNVAKLRDRAERGVLQGSGDNR